MSENGNSGLTKSRRGFVRHERNPSIPGPQDIAKKKPVRFGDDKAGLVIDGLGEVIGRGTASFYKIEEVDNERFVKLFQEGMRQAAGLSKAGATLYGFICLQIQDAPNTDKVELSYEKAARSGLDISDRVYRNGIRDLLEHEFIYESLVPGVFFVNIRFLFNGDRLAFVQGYQRKNALPKR